MIDSGEVCESVFAGKTEAMFTADVDVSQYIKITKALQSIGTFQMQLVPNPPKLSLQIGKHISIALSSKVELTFNSLTEWTIIDVAKKQWHVHFKDSKDAYRAISAIALVSKSTDEEKSITYDVKTEEGKAVSANDTVKISYWGFAVKTFPFLDRSLITKENVNLKLHSNRVPKALADGIIGMTVGSTRVIYVPNNTEPSFPTGNFIVVVTMIRAKFGDSGEPDPEPEAEEVEQPIEAPQPEEKQPEPAAEPEPERAPEPERETAAAEEQEEQTEEQKKQERLNKLRRMGAVASAMAVPIMPVVPQKTVAAEQPKPAPKKLAQETSAEPVVASPKKVTVSPAPVKPAPAPAAAPSADMKRLEERLDQLEKQVNKRLEALMEPKAQIDIEAVINGVSSLAVQANTKQTELEQLQKKLAELKSKNAGQTVAMKQLEAAKQELAEAQRKGALLDKKVNESNKKLRELEQSINEASTKAKAKGAKLIKQLMSEVFDAMNTTFESDGRYTGQEVGEQLYDLLRKHAFDTMNLINQEGLI